MRHLPLMILYAAALHIIWGVCGLADPSAYDSTALAAVYRLCGGLTPFICIGVAVAALIGVELRASRLRAITCMLPQQTLLIISAIGAIHAMQAGHFADGVERSRWFIVADQTPAILAAIGHTIFLLRFVYGVWSL